MAWPPMDPLYEQRLREDVTYLHSLWHQGPPRDSSVAASFPGLHHHHLKPFKATQFKRGKKQPVKGFPNQPPNSSPGPEWAVPAPPPPPPDDVWPNLVAKPDRQPLKLSPEEQLKLGAKNAHQRALKVVAEYLRYGDAGDDSDLIGSGTDEDEDLMDGDDGREEYSFFYNVFKEDRELMEYYEKNFARGEFGCLVCGALGGKKAGKKYKGCLPLVQHSINIAKTKKRTAHRSFGQAVCKILSWDINELPNVVSLLARGNNSGENKQNCLVVLNNVASVQGDAVEGKNEEAVQESGSIDGGILPSADEGDMVIIVSGDGKDTPSFITHNVSTVEADAVKGTNGEATPKSGAIGARDLPNDDGDMGIGSGENKESPSSSTANVLTVEANEVKGKNEEVVPENTAMGHGSSSTGDGGDASYLMGPPNQNSESIDMGLPRHLEEPTAEGSINVPFDENTGAGSKAERDNNE